MAIAGVGTTFVGGPLAVVGPERVTVVELAEVSVVREPGWCVECSLQFG